MKVSMKFFSLFIFIAICLSYLGCAMCSRTMETGAGEKIDAAKLRKDPDFKNYNLVKVALERSEKSGFYGLQATYMNDTAYDAFVNRNDFYKGSEIALVFFSFYEKDGMISPDEKTWSARMKKTMSSETGNWGYDSVDYRTSKPKFPDPVTTCYVGCHKAKKDNDYVFIEHPRK